MAFEHNDIVTVDRMNEAIAGGGGGGAVIVTATTEDDALFVLNKTWNELRTLLNSGAVVMLQSSGANFTYNSLLVSCVHNEAKEAYEVIFLSVIGTIGNVTASCDTADGYPSFEDNWDGK